MRQRRRRGESDKRIRSSEMQRVHLEPGALILFPVADVFVVVIFPARRRRSLLASGALEPTECCQWGLSAWVGHPRCSKLVGEMFSHEHE